MNKIFSHGLALGAGFALCAFFNPRAQAPEKTQTLPNNISLLYNGVNIVIHPLQNASIYTQFDDGKGHIFDVPAVQISGAVYGVESP